MDYLEYKNYLAHHGIEGQKWGKRNGPPYPLDPEDHSAAEKKANNGEYSQGVKQDRSGGSSDSDSSDIQKVPDEVYGGKKKMSPETKKKILIGAGITAGVIAVAGGTALTVYAIKKNPKQVTDVLDNIGNETMDGLVNGPKSDSAQVRAKQIAKEGLRRDIKEDMTSGFKDLNNNKAADARANMRKSMSDSFSESQKNRADGDLAEQMARGREKAETDRTTADAKMLDEKLRKQKKEENKGTRQGTAKVLADDAKNAYNRAKNFTKTKTDKVKNSKVVKTASKAWDKVDKAAENVNNFTKKVTDPVQNVNKAVRNVTSAAAATTGTIAVAKKMYDNYEASQMGMTPQEYQQYKKQLEREQREQRQQYR